MKGSIRIPGLPGFGLFTLLLFGFLLLTIACESTLMREFNHHMAGNNLNNAKSVIQQELSRNSQDPEANYLMGNLLSREENYEEANSYFDRSLNQSSVFREHIEYLRESNYRAEFNSGISAYQSGQFERAVSKFELALDIFPEKAEVYPLLAKSRLQLGRTDRAVAAYDICLELDANNIECGLNYSELLYDQSRFDDVIRVAKPIANQNPKDWRPFRLLTDAYLQTSQFDLAEDAFNQMFSNSNRYNHLKQFAVTLYNNGEVHRAEPYLVNCLERSSMDTDVLQILTDIYINSGNYDLVIEAGNRLLRAGSNSNSVKAKLMIAYEMTGDIDRYKEMQEELGLNNE